VVFLVCLLFYPDHVLLGQREPGKIGGLEPKGSVSDVTAPEKCSTAQGQF
jgi:hypothetical protein